MTRSLEIKNSSNFQAEDYELTYYADHGGQPTGTQFGAPDTIAPRQEADPGRYVPHGQDFWIHVRCVDNPDAPHEAIPDEPESAPAEDAAA